jgi:hypothetical protein
MIDDERVVERDQELSFGKNGVFEESITSRQLHGFFHEARRYISVTSSMRLARFRVSDVIVRPLISISTDSFSIQKKIFLSCRFEPMVQIISEDFCRDNRGHLYIIIVQGNANGRILIVSENIAAGKKKIVSRDRVRDPYTFVLGTKQTAGCRCDESAGGDAVVEHANAARPGLSAESQPQDARS